MTNEEMQKIIDTPTNPNILVTQNLYYPPGKSLFTRGFCYGSGLAVGVFGIVGLYQSVAKLMIWMGL